ncbi:MAG: VWA domain-containing protein [Candidatus Obscuribacterales bacterium]|nr:VWA domain-containing protein [Candidatus Obscuribacterales bacterium]
MRKIPAKLTIGLTTTFLALSPLAAIGQESTSARTGGGFMGELKEFLTSPALNQYVRTKVAPGYGTPAYVPGYAAGGWQATPPVRPSYPSPSRFSAYATESAAPMMTADPRRDSGSPAAFRTLLPAEARSLGRYDISVLIDRSGSMTTHDCPSPYSGAPISRWNWCREQTAYLARETNALSRGITVVPFATDFKRYERANVRDIHNIFAMSTPGGGTNLAEALKNELDTYFYEKENGRRNRPLMIAVISDGAPSSKNAVKKAIKEATKKMTRPDEIKITFLQVGNEQGGANFLRELDFDLAHQGARTDIVGARDFRQLLYTGLPAALAASVSDRPY